MPAPRSVLWRLLMPPNGAAGRRMAVAGVAGILMSAPVSLQRAVAPHPLIGWLLTGAGTAVALICLRQSWTPHVTVARVAVVVCVAFSAVTAVVAISQTAFALGQTDRQMLCVNDVAPDTIVAGQEVLKGIDPYTSFKLLDAERSLGCPFFSATPLRSGVFASFVAVPSPAQIERAAEATIHHHATGGLLLSFNYPAGTALLGVLGGRALVLISPFALLLAGLVVVRRAEPSTRRVTALALGAQAGLLGLIGDPFVDVIVVALLMVAISRPRGLAMGIALGVACAVKETAWYIAPALLVLALRDGKVRDFRYQAGAVLAIAAINVPFIVVGPSAWITGMFAPLTQPVFPLGVGPGAVGHVGSGVSTAFLFLMIVVVVMGTAICAFAPRRWAAAGVIVSSFGLWIGPRSLADYVALLGIIAVCTVAGSTLRRQPVHHPAGRLPEPVLAR
jgi:hypothetical protein